MVACERPFPIVVTTNSGYPLDQNLYQAVKGMSAAAQVVEPGRLHRDRRTLRRRLSGARQLPKAAVRARLAAGAARHDRVARLLALRPVGGPAAGAHPAEGARRPAERAQPGRRAARLPRADRGRGRGRVPRADADRKGRPGGRAARGPADDTLCRIGRSAPRLEAGPDREGWTARTSPTRLTPGPLRRPVSRRRQSSRARPRASRRRRRPGRPAWPPSAARPGRPARRPARARRAASAACGCRGVSRRPRPARPPASSRTS